MSSTEIIGGTSIGFEIKGSVKMLNKIIPKWKPEEINKLLCTTIFLYKVPKLVLL